MAKKVHKLAGEIHWAKVFESNRDQEGYKGQAKEYGGEYSVTLVVTDKEARAAHKATGSQAKFKTDPDKYDGQPYITFKRKHVVKIGGQEIPAYGGAPLLYNAEGDPFLPDDGSVLIGNNSQGIVKYTVYDAGENKGTRLDALQVTELNEFEAETGEKKTADEVKF